MLDLLAHAVPLVVPGSVLIQPTHRQWLWKFMHDMSVGQVPLQDGAAALPHGTGAPLQTQAPPRAGEGTQTNPTGQTPPHVGAWLWVHSWMMLVHPQFGVPGICLQTWLGSVHVPPH